MSALVLIVGLADYPAFQRRERFEGILATTCAVVAQAAAAEWASDHPGWRVLGMRCVRR